MSNIPSHSHTYLHSSLSRLYQASPGRRKLTHPPAILEPQFPFPVSGPELTSPIHSVVPRVSKTLRLQPLVYHQGRLTLTIGCRQPVHRISYPTRRMVVVTFMMNPICR